MSRSDKYEYAKLDSKIPSIEELIEQGLAVLKGFGFSEKEIIEEYNDHKSGFRIDLVGISEKLKVAVELGLCGPEKLFALKAYYDKVVWLPYWLTIIPEKAQPSNDIELELQEKIYELEKDKEELIRERNEIYRDIEFLYGSIEMFFDKLRKRIDEWSDYSWNRKKI